MNKIDCFTLKANNDTTEGRGGTFTVGRFKHHHHAISVNDDPRFYTKYGVMGTKQDAKFYVTPTEITIYDSVDEFFLQELNKVRERGIAKLTPEERKALGI